MIVGRYKYVLVGAAAFSLMLGPGKLTSSNLPAGGSARPYSSSHLDRTGLKRVGIASFYAAEFAGRKMADGTPMRPLGDNAASKTLPLGTQAKVTNLETGRTAVITIRDRGPYVKGRIVDLSPATARKIGIDKRQGIAMVEVMPIRFPLTDSSLGHRVLSADMAKNKRGPEDWFN